MNCQKIQDILSPYLDHVLSQEENIFIEKHIEKCPCCRQELDRLKKTIRILQSLPEMSLPESFSREIHWKLVVAQQEREGVQGGWMKKFRFQWISLSTAAVLMLALYTFLSPLLMKAGEQSDLPVPSTMQSEGRADSIGTDNLEEVKPQLAERKANDAMNDMINSELSSESNNKENQTASESQRQDTVQAVRGKNNTVETPKATVFNMQALAPETDIKQPEEKSLSKERSLSEEDPLSQDAVIELQIKSDEYEKFLDRIKGLPGKLPDVLEVAFENIDGEEKGRFIITVARGAIPQVIRSINTIGESVDQDVFDGEVAQDQTEYTTIKLIIKEKIE